MNAMFRFLDFLQIQFSLKWMSLSGSLLFLKLSCINRLLFNSEIPKVSESVALGWVQASPLNHIPKWL